GLGRILIHTDHHLEVVQEIKRNSSTNSISARVRRIQKLLQYKEFWVVRHIRKEANHVVNSIAKMASVDVEG
ncbi:hypothetical protein Golob_022597, partial [Gossypium lobatum]|nr:hypothetical protein [Gossypium lobatum]